MRFALLSVLAATASASMASDFARKDGVSLRGREPRELKTHKGPHPKGGGGLEGIETQTSAMLADEGSAAQQFMTTNKGKAKAERQGSKPKGRAAETPASPAAVETGVGGASNFDKPEKAKKERTKTPRIKEPKIKEAKPENFRPIKAEKAEKAKRVKVEVEKPPKAERLKPETKEKKPKKARGAPKDGEDAAVADAPVTSTAPPKVAAAPETTLPATTAAASTAQAVTTTEAVTTQPATTTIAAATTVPPLPACPATYDPSSTQYVEGSEIQMNGHIFKCLEDPYEAYCGIESIDAAWDDAQKQLWQNSWEHVGPCDMAAVTTAAPESTTEATAAETSTAPPQVAAAPETSDPTWSPTVVPAPVPATTAFPSVVPVPATTAAATTTTTKTTVEEDVDSPTSYPTWMPTETPPPCPPAYDDARTDYVAGEEVEVYEHTFSCNTGTGYVDFCNIAAVDSNWTQAETDMWNGAWVHVGPCTVPE